MEDCLDVGCLNKGKGVFHGKTNKQKSMDLQKVISTDYLFNLSVFLLKSLLMLLCIKVSPCVSLSLKVPAHVRNNVFIWGNFVSRVFGASLTRTLE